jgi:hypothetical protein
MTGTQPEQLITGIDRGRIFHADAHHLAAHQRENPNSVLYQHRGRGGDDPPHGSYQSNRPGKETSGPALLPPLYR